jgi:hypothetical protein
MSVLAMGSSLADLDKSEPQEERGHLAWLEDRE